jgi:large subunit ribosomal protein L25
MITLDADARDVKVNPKLIRKDGLLPAVFYGPGQQSTPISVNRIRFEKVLSEAGESTVITLKTAKGELDALIHDVDLDPVLGDPVHVDFYIVAKDRKVEVDVPVEYIGVAPAEKLGGVVMKVMHEISVSALPSKLPQHITVDLSALVDMDSDITVDDLKLPEGVSVVGLHGNDVIASVTEPAKEEEAPVAAVDLSAIEVEKKGKKEDTEGGEVTE